MSPASNDGDVAFACTTAFVDELVRGGLRVAAVSPGSRSAPIALALARHPGVSVFVHLDERASAFFALGAARASGRPAAVVTTSGTAAANLFPAVIEASMDGLPLLALTADRPPELRGVGASQTIDQRGLFGGYPRWSVDAPVPEAGPDAAATWRSLGARAVLATLGIPPGPVHVNLPFREPLTPSEAPPSLEPDVPLPRVSPTPPGHSEDEARVLHELATTVERGLVVAGGFANGDGPHSVLVLAETTGWPLLAEPTSGLRIPPFALSAGALLAGAAEFVSAHRPEIVVQCGAAPTSRAMQSLVASAERLVVLESPGRPADPAGAAWRTFRGDPGGLLVEAVHGLDPRAPSPWSLAWRRADDAARSAAGAAIDGLESASEIRVARDLPAVLADGGVLAAGSSMPVRDLDLFMTPRAGVRVLANRGASGIDGFVSTVLGIAATGARTHALLGDLTLLHDAGSLIWSARRGLNACLVVLNNRGGGIFSFLPQAVLPEHLKLFVTPHETDLGALAAAAGAAHVVVERCDELAPAVEGHAGGVTIVEVRTDRDRNVAEHRRVAEAVAAALR